MLNAVQSMLTGEKPSRDGYSDCQLASVNHAHASLRFGGTIAFAEVLTQHSKASGSFGWDGKELWVAGGLRATFRTLLPASRSHRTGPCFGFTTRLVLAMVRLTRCDRRAKIRNIDCQEGALGREDTTHGLPTHARLAGGCQK